MTDRAQQNPEDEAIPEEPGDGEEQGTRVKGVLLEILETALLAAVIFVLARAAVQSFRIQGRSMEPNLNHGQSLIVNKLVYYLHAPQRGDVVAFHSPENPRGDAIKRIVGLPGEEVEIIEGQVLIDGVRLEESYITESTYGSWGPEVVGEGEYYVLGDNRDTSGDSRYFGMLAREAIIGKAWLLYWPPQQWGLVPHYTFVPG